MRATPANQQELALQLKEELSLLLCMFTEALPAIKHGLGYKESVKEQLDTLNASFRVG